MPILNKNYIYLIYLFLIFLFYFPSPVFALEINFDFKFQDNPEANKEFQIEIYDLSTSNFDAKIYVEDNLSESKVISEIYNPLEEKWQSSYYYIKSISSDSFSTKIKIKKEGYWSLCVRIKSNNKSYQICKPITVSSDSIIKKDTIEESNNLSLRSETKEDTIYLNKKKEYNKSVVYSDKSKNITIYFLIISLILIIFLFLLRDYRFKKGRFQLSL